MKKYIHIIIGSLLLSLVTPFHSSAKQLDSATWAKMSEQYDYPPPKAKKKKPEKKKDKKDQSFDPPKIKTGGGAGLVNILMYIGIAALIALLLYVLVQADVIKIGSRKVKLNPTYDAENPEELVLSELEQELRDAAHANNYNRCLRYEFLLLLEKLQANGLIRWHKYNTNGEYLNQIIQYKHHKRVRDLTIVYEYYWYGEHVLGLDDYEKIAVMFEQLREEMGNE